MLKSLPFITGITIMIIILKTAATGSFSVCSAMIMSISDFSTMFLIWKPAIFRKVKEVKHLSGGVVLYAAQANGQTDAEIAKKGGFQTETRPRPPSAGPLFQV